MSVESIDIEYKIYKMNKCEKCLYFKEGKCTKKITIRECKKKREYIVK